MNPTEAAREVSKRWDHSDGAHSRVAPHILSAAKLMDLRVIVDHATMENDPDAPKLFAIVRRPRGHGGPVDAPNCIAYVHAQMKFEWLPDEAAWLELFSQLWPGY
jgi:hypothetical protein